MSKRKIVLSAAALILLTVFATLTGVYYMLGLGQHNLLETMRFFRALRYVETEYVGSAEEGALVRGAIAGMMDSLDDPHSVYLDPQMYEELRNQTEGAFGGIGVEMGMKDKEVTVVAPIADTPGAKAGLKTGDKIVRVDGAETKDLALDQVVARIRGEAGTKVVLTVRRAGEEDRDYEIVRSNIEIKTVGSAMLEDGIGYIRIAKFSEHTGFDVEKAYRALEAQGMRAVVLDLRNNPGGLLNVSVEIANLFVPKGPVVSTVRRDGTRDVFESSLREVKYPLAVLINGGSASASEIVAGAVQDTGAGVLVGTKSYGKGSVQSVIPILRDGDDALKLTIAKYYTPNGRSIDGVGIEPDVAVELDGKTDTQLAKAVELLRGKLQNAGL